MLFFVQAARDATRRVEAATDKEQLCLALDSMAGKDGFVAGPRTNFTGALSTTCALLGAGLGWFHLRMAGGCFILAALVLYFLFGRAWQARSDFVEAVLRRAAFFDGHLSRRTFDGVALWQAWSQVYPDFLRGDEDRRIEEVVDGEWRDRDGRMRTFSAYRFSFVDVESEIRTDDKGNRTKHVVRDKKERWGVIAELPNPVGVALSTVRKPGLAFPWTTSSIEFNGRFAVAAQSEQVAARFLTPTMVQEVLSLDGRFRGLDIHMPGASACISFDDEDLFSATDTMDPTDWVEGLKSRVRETCSLPRLNAVVDFLARMDGATGTTRSHTTLRAA
jgi:hypothetical protein